MNSKHICWIGHYIKAADIPNLQKDFGVEIDAENIIDLQYLAVEKKAFNSSKVSLVDEARKLKRVDIDKSTRISDWSLNLSAKQIQYGLIDCLALILIKKV